jgi:UDP-glucuronate 4-epimerase
MIMKKNIFLTGAAGFIGYHLALRLHQRGDSVIGFDNFNPYYSVSFKRNRANRLAKSGIQMIDGDICDGPSMLKAIQEHRTTHIVHLAAQAGVRYSFVNPHAYVKSNLEGFVNILEACRHTTTKLVYASSSSVYGLNTKIPFSVEDRADYPSSLYGATKKANEAVAFSYHHVYKIPMIGLRFFTVYGPWGRPDMAYFSFTKAILEGKPIEIYNHGEMQRDFTYIDDIIDGTVAAIDLEVPYEVFNLGNNHPEKLLTLVELLEKYLNKKSKKVFMPMQPGDIPLTYADINHSRDKLGYEPKISLEIGLKRFIDWFQDYRNFVYTSLK